MTSNGFDKFLKEFEDSCWESSGRITESIDWHDIIKTGRPAKVTGRNVYTGYVFDKTFYYMGHDDQVKFISIYKLGDKLQLSKTKPTTQPTAYPGDKANIELSPDDTKNEGFISHGMKHGLTRVFSQKKLDSAVATFKKLSANNAVQGIKKPLIIAAQMMDLDPRVLRAELESRNIDPDDPLAEGNLGTKERRPGRGQPRGLSFADTMGIIRTVGKSNDYDIVKTHATSDGMVSLIRDSKGDAYEVTVKPSYYGSYFDRERGVVEDRECPVSYDDIINFHENASSQTIAHFDRLLESDQVDDAWHVINSTVSAQDDIDEDMHKDYATMKSKPNDYLDGDEFVG